MVSDESLRETLKPQNVGVQLDFDYRVGLSWMLSWPGLDYAGPVINHSGATIAHRSVLAIIPGQKLGVVVLANTASAQGFVNMIAAETLKLALEVKTGIKPPRKTEDQPKEVEIPGEKLAEYAGYYVAGPQMAHVTSKDGRLYAQVAGLNGKVELIPREGGIFTGAYKAFGFLPIYVKELEGLSLSIERVNGRSALLAHVNGARFLIGEKVEPVPVPGPWLARLGEYELINIGEDFPGAPNKATLSYENGFLVVNSVSAFLGGVSASVPIRPVSDTEALIYGLGRGRGETVRIIERNGDDIAIVSGYEYKRKKKKG
ncbi:MAG: hypothetical protein HQK86_02865 [Nitrospinae bacterium]|nr:hypothetical protein [Nitrospinota bacterium]